MRRLPVFFVLDCSESMIGDNLRNMEQGLQQIVQTLRRDPHALETVWLSVLGFAGVARTLAPLVEIATFYPPRLPLGSGTSLGAALRLLMQEIDRSVVKTTAQKKGDWRPVVYLFTDGKPTDEIDTVIDEWKQRFASRVTMVAVALGAGADLRVLQRLTETVLLFESHGGDDFTKFIRWVTASVVAQSRSVGEGADAKTIPPLDASFIRQIKADAAGSADETSVVLTARCQKSRKPYVMKYELATQHVQTADFALNASHYALAGCFPVDDAFFEWSDPRVSGFVVNTDRLAGAPGCPYCGNHAGFGMCQCGKLLCLGEEMQATCPWCAQPVTFGRGSGHFDVARGRG